MIKLYTCNDLKITKQHIDKDTQYPSSPFNIFGGWIVAIQKGNFFPVYWYKNFPSSLAFGWKYKVVYCRKINPLSRGKEKR